MSISVTCQSCSSKLKAPDGLAGRTVKCPKCGNPVVVSPSENLLSLDSSIPVLEQALPAVELEEALPAGEPPRTLRRKPQDSEAEDKPDARRKRRRSINDMVPDDLKHKLRKGEEVFDFAYIDLKGGCGSTQSANQWILITNERILYEATIRDQNGPMGYTRTSGSMPTPRVSFVGTATAAKTAGCNRSKISLLKINSGGGEIELVIPSEQEASRLQGVIDQLISQQ